MSRKMEFLVFAINSSDPVTHHFYEHCSHKNYTATFCTIIKKINSLKNPLLIFMCVFIYILLVWYNRIWNAIRGDVTYPMQTYRIVWVIWNKVSFTLVYPPPKSATIISGHICVVYYEDVHTSTIIDQHIVGENYAAKLKKKMVYKKGMSNSSK